MTEQPRYTIEGLPVLVSEIMDAMKRDLATGRVTPQHIIKRIKEQNPFVVQYANAVMVILEGKGVPADIAFQASLEGVLFTYEMLRKQAEANKLTKQYGGDATQ
ncbi:hypothetical protein HYX05_03745 [Candidatus Woesearchaeota archaeon]|nr:hypothetical protein [Candidatus Woesearchaeota archaeon]